MPHQHVGCENAGVRRLPIVFHAPIAHENHQRPYPLIEVAILLDDPIHLCRI
jgi:hypothetical protein